MNPPQDNITTAYIKKTGRSKEAYERAVTLLPGGASASGRTFKPHPLYMNRATGNRIYDLDNNEYIDYLMGYGSLLLGHRHPDVLEAVQKQINRGFTYGTPTEPEIDLAEKISNAIPCAEMVRFANSGTEAVAYALKVVRAYTGRDKVAKFEGGYHGNFDDMLMSFLLLPDKAGPVDRPNPIPFGSGIPSKRLDDTVVLPYNNIEASKAIIEENSDELAAVIIEPFQGAAGCISAEKEFLSAIRKVTEDHDIVLIFDEIYTGFRLAFGGATEYFGIVPDMVTLGKIVGGGFPIGALAGRKEIMEKMVPTKNLTVDMTTKVYQSGTFNAYPLTMAAGLSTIRKIEEAGNTLYQKLNRLGDTMIKGLGDVFLDSHIDARVTGLGSMCNIHFVDHPVRSVRDLFSADGKKVGLLYLGLLNNGIFVIPPVHLTLSTLHDEDDVRVLLEAAARSIRDITSQG